MTTDTLSPMRLVALWAGYYADWQEGREASPSASDLVTGALQLFDIESENVDEMVDALDTYASYTHTLEEQADAFIEMLDMGEPYACDRCGDIYDEAGGDGYLGLCPSCADATEPKEDDESPTDN